MPLPIDDGLYQNIIPNPSTSDSPHITPIHVAQHNQNIEQQRRKDRGEQGLELQSISGQGEDGEPKREISREPRKSQTPPVSDTPDSPERDHLLAKGYSSDSSTSSTQMGTTKRTARSRDSNGHTSASPRRQNGHSKNNMNSHVEMRHKHPSLDSPTAASQTENLMSRESFSLDHEPSTAPDTTGPSSHSFWALPRQDRRNFLLLVLLYFLQGIPMGLAGGSVPVLLKSHLSYGQIGIFSLASYPYSLKLLWSPIVDAVWSTRLGRRKTWIMPIQVLSGLGMIYLGGRVKEMMVKAGADGGAGVWGFTWWWFFLVLMCATQDIAVDGGNLLLRNAQTSRLTE